MSRLESGNIVVIDDDEEMCSMMTDFLKSKSFHVESFLDPEKALEWLSSEEAGDIDLIVTDLRMPGIDGLELIERNKKLHPDVPAILITAFGSIETAIEATKGGAFDFVVKPFELDKIELSVRRAVRFCRLKKENNSLREKVDGGGFDLIGKSKEMRRVFDLVQRVSKATANVLIMGESGTGKEMVARSIHFSGNRKNKAFVPINCTAIPDTLLESELFGHAKGAFTGAIQRKKGLFEEAQGGTLFLDEIGDLELSLQAKLLRVLQEKKIKPVGDNNYIDIDVRIVAATHKDLKQAIKENTFREDLYYRLCVIPVSLPPLRHRKDDIPTLVHFFLNKYCKMNSVESKQIHPSAMEALMAMPWNGNVRELENVIERLVVLVPGEEIQRQDIPQLEGLTEEDFLASVSQDMPSLEDVEKRYIKFILDRVGGRKDKASSILGINRRTLYRKERDYGFVAEDSAEEN